MSLYDSKTLEVLSTKQVTALAAIESFTTRRGYGPTLSEVAELLDLHSKNGARHYVMQLTALGMVTYEQVGETRQAAVRTLRLTEKGNRVLKRIEGIRSAPFLRGKYALALAPRELRVARRIGLVPNAYPTYREGELTVISFRSNHERDFWAGEIVEALGK